MTPQIRRAKGFVAIEQFEAPSCNLATITLTPEFEANGKWKQNIRSDMLVQLISGRAMIQTELHPRKDAISFCRNREKTFFIPKGVMYRWIVKSKKGVTFYAFSTPAWTPDQHKEIERT